MKDKDKTSEQMTKELVKVRQRIAELETAETEHKRIEDALRLSTERLQALLDTAPVVICQSDFTTKITYVNKKFEEVTGYKREEVVGKHWTTLGMLSKENARLLKDRMVEKLKGSPPTPMEVQVKRRDGQLIWVTGIGEIIRERSKPVGFHVVAQEITDYKLVQQKIQRAAEEWRTTFDTIPDLVSIHDADFRVLRSNKAFARTCKMKPQAVVGSICYELIHGTKKPYAHCPLRQALTTRKPSWCEFFNPHLGIYMEVTCSPILNGNGDAVASVHIVRDMTERRQMLETLQESEEHYRLVADNAADVIWTVDLNMRPTYISPSITRLLGYSVEEAMAKPMEEVFTPASYKLAMEALAEELAVEELEQKDLLRSRLLEIHMIRQDGSTVPVDIKYTFLRDADTKPVGVLAIARDITERKQAEEALRGSEERYRALFEQAADSVLLVDAATGALVEFNEQAHKSLGYTREEFRKLKISDFEANESAEEVANHFRKMLKEGEGFFETQHRTKRGEIRDVQVSTQIISIGERKLISSIFRDITERKQAEEALRESVERYRALVELGVRVGEAIIMRQDTEGEEGIMTFVSDEWANITGYSKKELLGTPFHDLVSPEYKQASLERYRRRMRGESVSGLFELAIIGKDGTEIPIELTSAYTAYEGKRANVAFIRDITERRQAEAKLKESESKYRAIFETTVTAMIIIEEDTTISLANTEFAKLSGYSQAEIEGKKSWTEFIFKDDMERLKEYHRQRRIDPDAVPKRYEARLVDRKGNIKDVYASVDIIPGTKRSVASILDMSERKQMQEQLIVADRLATLGGLVSGIAHELNNPLTSIIGFAQLLLAKDIPDGIKEDLNVIYEEAERTSKVVRNLLTFARKHEPEKKPVNMNEAIKVVLTLRAYEQKVHNIQVSTQFAPDLPEIMADGFQLQQVFLNIIINAEYFMTSAHGGGNLSITTERVGDKVRASFTDDGAGIPQENLNRLFDPFFTTKDVGKGTGLGLSICHGIVTEHSGSIYAESEPGKGAAIIVELPIK